MGYLEPSIQTRRERIFRMNVLPLILAALCVMVITYRYYSAFLASRVVALNDRHTTPAHTLKDGHNYIPTNKWVVFGHHFAAIAGSGPLIGPVLAAQFGYMPGFLWLLAGVCLAGAVQDFMILVASLRRKGRSLAEIARHEISPLAGAAGSLAIFFIVVMALAGLGLADFCQDIENIDLDKLVEQFTTLEQCAGILKAQIAQKAEAYRGALEVQYDRIFAGISK